MKVIHGESTNLSGRPTPEYRAYEAAKSRCTNPRVANFDRYGGRGVEFRFTSFEEFRSHIGRRPTPQHTLDRINNNGHYEIGNVRWATRKEQARNFSTNRLISRQGITKAVCEWADSEGLGRDVIYKRLRRGWCDECAAGLPMQGHKSKCLHRGETT